MRGSGLARGRALSACAAGALGLALAGCATRAASNSTISGHALTIYASAPAGAADDTRAQDVLDAERLAFAGSSHTVGSYSLKLVVLHGAKPSDNARTAIKDSNAVGYVGEIIPGQSADSLGIVGDAEVLQVSPTDTALELTQASPAVSGSPGIYYEASGSNSRTFARVVPTTALEARALLAAAATLHVSKLYVATDGSAYGNALAAPVKRLGGTSVPVVQGAASVAGFRASGADAVLFAGSDRRAAATFLDGVAQADPTAHLFAPSALDDQGFAGALTAAAQSTLQISSPGFLPAELNPAGQQFLTSFNSTYGHQPSPQAIFGYEAMAALMSALREAGKSINDRTTILHDFFAIHNRNSVLGAYSIDANGDTNLGPFVISHLKGGQLTPYRFLREQG